MKTITIKDVYNTLKELSSGFKKPIDNKDELLKLKDDLELTINAETLKGLSSKQRVTKCSNYAKKIGKKRPIFGCTCNDQLKDKNGAPLQVFTDSFFLVALNENDSLPIKDYKECSFADYPRLAGLVNRVYAYTITINVSDILKKLKLNNFISLNDYIKDHILPFNIALAKDVTKRALEFLNVKNDENITVKFNSSRVPVRIERGNGSWGIICPINID